MPEASQAVSGASKYAHLLLAHTQTSYGIIMS